MWYDYSETNIHQSSNEVEGRNNERQYSQPHGKKTYSKSAMKGPNMTNLEQYNK